jgi:Predicted integral membrane protein (DUF2269)
VDLSLASTMVFLHVAAAFAFVGGLIGRSVTLGRARRSQDLAEIDTLVAAAGPFERMVTQGSLAVLVLGLITVWAQERSFVQDGGYWLLSSLLLYLSVGLLVPLVFLPRGRVFEAAIGEARQQGRVTPELSAVFRDPVVAFARTYEAVVVGVIVALMVLKPF